MRIWLAAAIGLLMPSLVMGQPVHRRIVGELFTSAGCSSCLPAHANLLELAQARPDLLLLTFHVTFWSSFGWHDPYSFDLPTQLQRRFLALGISPEIYTPALIADGKLGAIGFHSGAFEHAFRQAALSRETAAQSKMERGATGPTVSVGARAGMGTLVLIGCGRRHRTHAGGGENSGRTPGEAASVRSVSVLRLWSGQPVRLQASYPAGQEVAVFLQRANGHIVGAGVAL